MLSRVAANLFWFGRYLERADNLARMADVDYQASLEGVGPRDAAMWQGLMAASAARESFIDAAKEDPGLSEAEFLILRWDNPGSLRATMASARNLARTLREHISREVWEQTNGLYLELAARAGVRGDEIHDLCSTVKQGTQTILGLYDNTALRDEGREWFRCGLYLERADMTSRIIDAKYHVLLPSPADVGGVSDRFQWMAILRSAGAWEAFRKSPRRQVGGIDVVDLLMFNRAFPRSLVFSTMALLRHYRQGTNETPRTVRLVAEREIALLDMELQALDIDLVVEGGLHEFVDDFQAKLIGITDAITSNVFRATPDPRRSQEQRQ